MSWEKNKFWNNGTNNRIGMEAFKYLAIYDLYPLQLFVYCAGWTKPISNRRENSLNAMNKFFKTDINSWNKKRSKNQGKKDRRESFLR